MLAGADVNVAPSIGTDAGLSLAILVLVAVGFFLGVAVYRVQPLNRPFDQSRKQRTGKARNDAQGGGKWEARRPPEVCAPHCSTARRSLSAMRTATGAEPIASASAMDRIAPTMEGYKA